MKRIKWMPLLLIVVSCFIFALSACGGDGGEVVTVSPDAPVLVAFFSCTNNTEKVARRVADATGGELYEIVPEQRYTAEDLDYNNGSSRATTEQRDPEARPAIRGTIENMESFGVVYLGYPIWWGEAPKIIYTFLESYDFSGKTIVPFCTSGSSGIGNSAVHLRTSASGANWLSGKRFETWTTESDIRSWINGLGI